MKPTIRIRYCALASLALALLLNIFQVINCSVAKRTASSWQAFLHQALESGQSPKTLFQQLRDRGLQPTYTTRDAGGCIPLHSAAIVASVPLPKLPLASRSELQISISPVHPGAHAHAHATVTQHHEWHAYFRLIFPLLPLLFVPHALHRAILERERHRAGLCSNCAYPRGTSQSCTECGSPLPELTPGRTAPSTAA